MRSRLQDYYVFTEGQFSLTINVARTISVGIYGEVARSGTYTLSALNGPLNALAAAGGPTARGSVRNIELLRDGERYPIDVYAFLQDPAQSGVANLRDRDIINVPLAAEVVNVQGGVRRPMYYELRAGESLADALAYAGGLASRAAADATRVERYEDGALRVIDLAPGRFAGFDLSDGDLVEVPVVAEPIADFVTVSGEVLVDGRFGYREGLTLGEVLDRARVQPSARRDLAFVQRRNDDGTLRLERLSIEEGGGGLQTVLRRGDQISVLSAARFTDDASFTVRGAVRDEEITLPYPQDGKLTLEEAILLGGGLAAGAVDEALVLRTPVENRERREYIRVSLSDAPDFTVEPLDQIVLYTRDRYTDSPTVSISGAVRTPVSTPYDPSLSLRDLIFLAGGTRYDASTDRVEVYRLELSPDGSDVRTETVRLGEDGEALGDFALLPFDEVYVRSLADFEPIQSVAVLGEVRFPGSYARIAGENRVSDFVSRAGGLTGDAFAAGATLLRRGGEINYVVSELDEILDDPRGPENIILRPGDTILVPKPQALVTIYTPGTNASALGADSLQYDGSIQVTYQGPQSADWYVDRYAGGFDPKTARKRTTTVTTGSGGVRATKSFLGIRNYPQVEPGSKITVGLKPQKPPREREPTSWGEVAQVTVAGLTTIVTLFVLLTR